MGEGLAVTLFCEDRAHELFVRALIDRVAREEGIEVSLDVSNAVGGKGKVIDELRTFQRVVDRGSHWSSRDLLAVVVDSNNVGWREQRRRLEAEIDGSVWPDCVVGCPEPHIEKWCFVDERAFKHVVGVAPPNVTASGRDAYKAAFHDAVSRAPAFVLTDAMELAPDIVEAIEWPRASRDRSLKDFISQLHGVFRRRKP